jgi:hypothetical protein
MLGLLSSKIVNIYANRVYDSGVEVLQKNFTTAKLDVIQDADVFFTLISGKANNLGYFALNLQVYGDQTNLFCV